MIPSRRLENEHMKKGDSDVSSKREVIKLHIQMSVFDLDNIIPKKNKKLPFYRSFNFMSNFKMFTYFSHHVCHIYNMLSSTDPVGNEESVALHRR